MPRPIKPSTREKRMKQLEIDIANAEGQLNGYRAEWKRLYDASFAEMNRLKQMIQIVGYQVDDYKMTDGGLEVKLSSATQFKDFNIHAVQRKMKRFNLKAYWFSYRKDADGRTARDESGRWTHDVEWFKVQWVDNMSKADIQNQVVELGIEAPPLTKEQIEDQKRFDAEFPFLDG